MPAAARTTTTDLASRARELDAGVFERAAEQVVRADGATVVSTPSLPTVPHLNCVFVDGAADADAIEALLAEHHGRLRSHRVNVADGHPLAEELTARGWAAYGLRLLARDGAEPPPESDVFAEEVLYGHVRALREEWLRAGDWKLDGERLAQALAGDERLFAATPTRAFATFERGRPLAYALLLDGGRDGMLEDVYTTPQARGRGLSTGVIAAVLHAAAGARYETVFVPTDADTGASGLYERLGFRPVALQRVLVRERTP